MCERFNLSQKWAWCSTMNPLFSTGVWAFLKSSNGQSNKCLFKEKKFRYTKPFKIYMQTSFPKKKNYVMPFVCSSER